MFKHGQNLLEKCGEEIHKLLDQIFLKEFLVSIMLHLKDLDNMILKNVLTQFLISCPKICIKKKKNHMLSKLKQKGKVMSKQVMNNGISIF